MTMAPPAEIGMALEEVDTPALIVELDAFERNLERMAHAVRAAGVRLRPHAKTHKCAEVALRQMALGAVGVCSQKVSEAEALVGAGVSDVLVTNEIVGKRKLERLMRLACDARLGVCVDDAGNVDDMERVARAAGAEIDVLVEIDVGGHRCGVAPGEPALALARRVAACSRLRFAGLQAYQNKAQHVREFAARRNAVEAAVAEARRTVELLAANDIACPIVTGAGTGTYLLEGGSGVYDELQAGSYVFMDADYARNHGADGGDFTDFEHSLFVWTTVMSTPSAERAIVDAGLKASSVDSGMPLVHQAPGVVYAGASDEHGGLRIDAGARPLALGEKLRLVPGHCDPTVNLHDWYVCVRDGVVQSLWPIVARGAVF